jgi:MoxR-like ATPase
LPEAQIDRFLFKTIVEYPKPEEESKILETIEKEKEINLEKVLSKNEILDLQNQADKVYVSNELKNLIVKIVEETRKPDPRLVYGASPR